MAKRRKDRLYSRKGRGWYMDLRDLGGGQRACVPPGERYATQDRDTAMRLLAQALLNAEQEARQPKRKAERLADYAVRHLTAKAAGRRDATVERDERALRVVIGAMGNPRLSEITPSTLMDYIPKRLRQPGQKKGTRIAEQTVRHELYALSSLFRSAIAEGLVTENPVLKLPKAVLPKIERSEAVWLEPHEAAQLLRVAKERDANPPPRAIRFIHPILATYLYTGGRKQEVEGLEVGDVDFVRGFVHLRHNQYRKLKRPHHDRRVPLWPDLGAILRAYVAELGREGGLLFPSSHGGMLKDLRGSIGALVRAAGIGKHVTTHTFRHTYAATRIQTLDHGAPVSPYTVMRELGHRSLTLIEETYGHLQTSRVRSEGVEYREPQVIEMVG